MTKRRLTRTQIEMLKLLVKHPKDWHERVSVHISSRHGGTITGVQRTLASLEGRGLIRWVPRGELLYGSMVTAVGWVITDAGRAAVGEIPRCAVEAPEVKEKVNGEHAAEPERCSPDFESAVATLEKFVRELQAEIEWVAELHRRDKTGQAKSDQAMLGALKAKTEGLVDSVKHVAKALGFGFEERS